MDKRSESLFRYLSSMNPNLRRDEIKEFLLKSRNQNLDKMSNMINQGDEGSRGFFLSSGSVAYIIHDKDGDESVKSLHSGPSLIGSVAVLAGNTSYPFSIRSITPVEYLSFEVKDFRTLLECNPHVERIWRILLERLFLEKENREVSFLLESATERYLKFKSQKPELDNITPLNLIASYLGMTPVTLSRIRKKQGLINPSSK